MTILDEYLEYQKKYELQYGSNTIVFMCVGTFYESYGLVEHGQKLRKVADVMNLILTKKSKAILEINESNPYLLGFPAIAKSKYIKILIDCGYTVVIYDQYPAENSDKKEFVRKLSGIYSAGTYIDNLNSQDTNNLMCIFMEDEKQMGKPISLLCIGISVIDLSTGISKVFEAQSKITDVNYSIDETIKSIHLHNPKEIIIYTNKLDDAKCNKVIAQLEIDDRPYNIIKNCISDVLSINYQNIFFERIFKKNNMLTIIEDLNLEYKNYGRVSYLLLLDYAYKHNDHILKDLQKPQIYEETKFMTLENNSVYQLNILENTMLETPNKRYTCLFDVVNKTSTAIGRRFLKEALLHPLLDIKQIQMRYDGIDEFKTKNLHENYESYLNNIADIERLHRKMPIGILNPSEFAQLDFSYQNILQLIIACGKNKILTNFNPPNCILERFNEYINDYKTKFNLDAMKKYNLNDITGSFVNPYISREIDDLQRLINYNFNYMELFRGRLSVILKNELNKNKKNHIINEVIYINHTDKFGYYLCVTKSRCNVLKNALKTINEINVYGSHNILVKNIQFKDSDKSNVKIIVNEIAECSEKLTELNQQIGVVMRKYYLDIIDDYYQKYEHVFHEITKYVAIIDFLKSGALVAKEYNYCKPIVSDSDSFISCKELRHPIIEHIIDTPYIPHSVTLNNDNIGMLIYGINSSGKTSLMKSIGCSIILAQSGLFCPAMEYKFSPFTSVFSRISGFDNMFKSQSSFELEMSELRNIIKRSNNKVLVLADEIARGTEILSAEAITASSIMHLTKNNCKFVFSTHLHNILKLNAIKNLKNVQVCHLNVTYNKENDVLIFDRELRSGDGSNDYGLTVAKYLLQDDDFILNSENIKKELLNEPTTLINIKKSKYNSNVYMQSCMICGYTVQSDKDKDLETHHINKQKDCDKNGFVKEKQHIKKNSASNLIVLCYKCHDKLHDEKNNFQIIGYEKTSNGKQIKINN